MECACSFQDGGFKTCSLLDWCTSLTSCMLETITAACYNCYLCILLINYFSGSKDSSVTGSWVPSTGMCCESDCWTSHIFSFAHEHLQCMQYALNRIPSLNEFCVICDERHVLETGLIKVRGCSV